MFSLGLKSEMFDLDFDLGAQGIVSTSCFTVFFFFLPRDAGSAKRGFAVVSRTSVTLRYRGHMVGTSLKLITRIIGLWS